MIDRAPRCDGGAGEASFATAAVDRHAVQFGGRIALARQPDHPPRDGREPRVGKERRQQRLVGDTGRIVIAKQRIEFLLFARVTAAQRDVETIGHVEDIVRKDRPILAVLRIAIERRAFVVDRIEIVEPGDNGRAGRAERTRQQCLGRDAVGRRRAVEPRQAAPADDAARREATVLVAEAQIVGDGRVFIGEKAADQPVELVLEQRTLQTDFLREGAELALRIAVRRAVENVD